jgi:opacity protein-like surface antigen
MQGDVAFCDALERMGCTVHWDEGDASGTGNSVNNAYQIAAGVRYRLYEELSLTMAYKFYGNSQANMNLDNGVQITLGSPVTQAAEVGLNFSF